MTEFRIHDHYDHVLYTDLMEEYYLGSGFANFGYREEMTGDARQAGRHLMERLVSFLPDSVGTLLDVACGLGATTAYLRERFPDALIIAGNISRKQLLSARARAGNCRPVLMDAASPGFRDGVFDAVICVEAAFHFRTREQFFKETWRVLKPGGFLVLSDVLFLEGAEKRMRSFHEENFLPDLNAYRGLCRRCGFTDVQVFDATRQCWEGHFWNAIRFMHEKYLYRQVDVDTLRTGLEKTYRIGAVLHLYLLAAMIKEEA